MIYTLQIKKEEKELAAEGEMEHISEFLQGLKPVILLILAQISYAVMNILYKFAAIDGMNMRILVAYRFIFATPLLVPIALIVERGRRPKLTYVVLFQSFACAFFGGLLAQNTYVESLVLTSATFAAAMANLIPAITLTLSVIFRSEDLGLRTTAGITKLLGTIVGTAGAMSLTLYKGPNINFWSTNINLLKQYSPQQLNYQNPGNHILGSVLSISSCLSNAFWLIIQGRMSKRYPCHYSSSALMCVMGSIQCVIFALCTEKNWSKWKLGWDIKASYSFFLGMFGIVVTGLVLIITTHCLHNRGPLFVSSFSPLSLVLIAMAGSLLLQEKLHLGSMIGAVLIVCGLYMVLWAKGKEIKEKARLVLPTIDGGESLEMEYGGRQIKPEEKL